ncbi:molybdenum cofactor biosynthesis protein MoaE [Methylomonas paludis]|uniref:Molybdopterin synthase catalytic subunit n=1 Tax=Methylomonas paludis TaxID=1173101 RepID=A0A975MLX9_9GAMM|nr:molybdenum cofactor biosynthesis protein MoaE [Methylomonas paludis]QWF70318.1 molybdenum cofactor biosynthesis protein MoaE [Methylomonas paludis]
MSIVLTEQVFDPWQAIAEHQARNRAISGKHGAVNVFVGTMRDFNQGDSVQAMYLEHYPGMTEQQLQAILNAAAQQWPLLDSLIIHRIGKVLPDETIVLTAAWAAHRGDAFDACRFIMEALKSRAPFWKKETLASGSERWVEHNSDGYLPKV